MTALVPNADDSEKKDELDVESMVKEDEDVKIKIAPMDENGKTPSEDREEIAPNVKSCAEKFKERRVIWFLSILWFLSVTCSQIMRSSDYGLTRLGKREIRMIQGVFVTLGSWICFSVMKNRFIKEKHSEISWTYYWKFIIPIAILMVVRSRIVPDFVPTAPMGETSIITIELFLPFFMLTAANMILKSNVSYFKIVPLAILGASIFAYLNMRFLRVQFEEAASCAFLIALEMVLAKKVMQEKRMHPVQLLIHLGCLFLFLLVLMPVFIHAVFRNGYLDFVRFDFSPRTIISYVGYGVVCWIQTTVTLSLFSVITPSQFSALSVVTHLLSAVLLGFFYYFILDVYGRNMYFVERY